MDGLKNNEKLINKIEFILNEINKGSFTKDQKKNFINLKKKIKKFSSKKKKIISILNNIFIKKKKYIFSTSNINIKNKNFIKNKIKNLYLSETILIIFIDNVIIYIDKKLYNFIKISQKNNIYKNKYNINKNIFVYLNNCFNKKKIYIKIKKNKNIKKPIYILKINSYYQNNNINMYNIYLKIEENTKLSIIEHIIDEKNNISYINNKILISIKKNSILNYLKIINLNKKSYYLSNNDFFIKKKSILNYYYFILKAKKININSNIFLNEKSKSKLYSLSLINKNDIINNIYTFHLQKKSESYQKHNSLSLKEGIFEFKGLININKKSYKTKAYLNNENLFLNKKTKIKTSPQVKIYNKKSKCKHSSIIKYLNKDQFFYLSIRGLSIKDIYNIISFSFIQKSINFIKNKKLKKIINKIIYKK